MRALVVATCLLAACHSHDVRLQLDGVPDSATNIVVSLALGNDVAPDLVYPIGTVASTETLVLSLPQRAGWLTATVTAQDAGGCDLAIGAGGIANDFGGDVDDEELPLFPAGTTQCPLVHTPGMLSFDTNTFVLGCDAATDPECATDETPSRTAQLGAFEIDATEVTVGAYTDCVNAGVCAAPNSFPDFHTNNDAAQNGLTWDAAGTFCGWVGKALPTEAQWEAAMRGPEGRTYPWGNTEPDCSHANYSTSPVTTCVPVNPDVIDERRFPDGFTPLGIADAAGNVAEWVSDFYLPRSSLDSTTLVTGPPSGIEHVTKGGSWLDADVELRGAARFAYLPDGTDPNDDQLEPSIDVGVRCAHTR